MRIYAASDQDLYNTWITLSNKNQKTDIIINKKYSVLQHAI